MNTNDHITTILQALWEKNLYVTEHFANDVLNFFTLDEVLEFVEARSHNHLISLNDVNSYFDLKHENVKLLHQDLVLPEIPYCEGRDRRYHKYDAITKEEKDCIDSILQAVRKLTSYHSPKGLVTIDYDVDLANFLVQQNPDREFFFEFRLDIIDELSHAFCMYYF